MTETEIKIRWTGSASEAHSLIERQGYRLESPRALETNQLFDRGSGELRQSGLLFRLRRYAGDSTVTYKGPPTREIYKSREEIEFKVSDPEALQMVLERLGYYAGFRYEKYRTQFLDPAAPGHVVVDETPIGIFLELEGLEDWIDSTANKLGFTRAEYMTESYAALYQLHRKTTPEASPDMTFQLKPLELKITKEP